MKKILYVVSTLKRSGPTNQLFNIIKNLDRVIFEPIVLTLSPEPEDSRWLDYEKLGIEVYSLSLSRLAGMFLAKSRLRKFVKDKQPHLIHTQGLRADVLSSSLNFSVPKIATIRNFPQVDFVITYGRILGRWMVWRQIAALKKKDLVVGVSKAVENNLVKEFNLSNATVIQNGVDTEVFKSCNEQDQILLRQKLNLPADMKIWLVSGHLSERKDPLFLIRVWQKVSSFDKSQQLVFIGGGALEDVCRNFSTQMKQVNVIGRVNNVDDYLMASDFYLSSSVAEGLPNAALEAMACGLPVLLSDIEPHKEIHDMSPSVGELFTLGDEESFIESFKLLANSNYDEHQTAALNLIDNNLSASQMSQKYQNIYHELIGA